MDTLDIAAILENNIHQLALNELTKIFSDQFPEEFAKFTEDTAILYEKYPSNYAAVFDAVLVSYLIETGLFDKRYDRIYRAIQRGLTDEHLEHQLLMHTTGRMTLRKEYPTSCLLQADAN